VEKLPVWKFADGIYVAAGLNLQKAAFWHVKITAGVAGDGLWRAFGGGEWCFSKNGISG